MVLNQERGAGAGTLQTKQIGDGGLFIFPFNFITIKHVVLPVSVAKPGKEEQEEHNISAASRLYSS